MRTLSGTERVSVVVIHDAADDPSADAVPHALTSQSVDTFEVLSVLHHSDRDFAPPLNAALRQARSEWIMFVRPGDTLAAQALEWLTKAAATEAADIAHGGWTSRYGDPATANFGPCEPDLFPHTVHGLPFPLAACLLRRSAAIAAGGFDDRSRPFLAWDLLQRLARSGARFAAVRRVVAHLRRDGDEEWCDPLSATARGTEIIRRGHARDDRVHNPVLSHRDGASPDALADALYAYVAWQAAGDLGHGRDARPLLDLAGSAPPNDVDGPGLALCIYKAVAAARQVGPEDWPHAWLDVQQVALAFLDALEKRAGLPGLRLEIERGIERCVMRGVGAHTAISFGGMVREPLDVGQAIQDVRVGPGKECLQAVVAAGQDTLVSVEIPALRELVAAEEVTAAINDGRPALVRMAPHPPVDAERCSQPFGRGYFERTFEHPDPWCSNSDYERAKLAHTLALLPATRFGSVLEVGCAEGAFSHALAPLCGALLGIDISTRALARAAARCAAFAHARFVAMDLREGLPSGRYGLVVCNETLYYLADRTSLRDSTRALADRLEPGAFLLTANARCASDEPGGIGFDWGLPFGAHSIVAAFAEVPGLRLVRELRTPLYRVALFARDGSSRPPAPVVEEHPLPAWPDSPHRQALRGVRREGGDVSVPVPLDPQPDIPVLLYHRVAADGPPHLAPYRVSPARFDHQLECLRREGYQPISIETWRAARLCVASLPPRPILITFDDGYRDFATDAWPPLQVREFPLIVFLVADAVEAGISGDESWRGGAALLGWTQILRLQAEGVAFGSHGARHRKLTRVTLTEACLEAARSRTLLERRLRRPVREFAYPYGAHNQMIARAVATCGYDVAFTSAADETGVRLDPMRLPRLPVGDYDGEALLTRLAAWSRRAAATVPPGAEKLRLVMRVEGLAPDALKPLATPFLHSLAELNGGAIPRESLAAEPGNGDAPPSGAAVNARGSAPGAREEELWIDATPEDAATQFAHNVTPQTALACVHLTNGREPTLVDEALSAIFSRANALFPAVQAIVDLGSNDGRVMPLARTGSWAPARLALSVVVPTYNRCQRLDRLWTALRDQTLPPDAFEVVVVDDGSTDSTSAWLAGHPLGTAPRLRGLSQRHEGPAAARNRGLREAAGAIVLFLDDDLVPERECLARHMAFHARHPGLGHASLGSTSLSFGAEDAPLRCVLDAAGSPLLDWSYVRAHDPDDLGWRCFWSGHLSVKRDFLLTHGAFDDRTFKSAMGEDLELGRRLQRAGLVVHFLDDAKASSPEVLDLAACVERERRKGYVGPDLAEHGLGDEWSRGGLERQRICSHRALDEIVTAVGEFLRGPSGHEERRMVLASTLCFANLVGAAEREGDLRDGVGAVVALLQALAVTQAGVGQQWHEKDRQIAELQHLWRLKDDEIRARDAEIAELQHFWRLKDDEIRARDAEIAYLSGRWERVRQLMAPALWARRVWRRWARP